MIWIFTLLFTGQENHHWQFECWKKNILRRENTQLKVFFCVEFWKALKTQKPTILKEVFRKRCEKFVDVVNWTIQEWKKSFETMLVVKFYTFAAHLSQTIHCGRAKIKTDTESTLSSNLNKIKLSCFKDKIQTLRFKMTRPSIHFFQIGSILLPHNKFLAFLITFSRKKFLYFRLKWARFV